MASTSTNKQPLLVDRVLHEIVDLAGATVETNFCNHHWWFQRCKADCGLHD